MESVGSYRGIAVLLCQNFITHRLCLGSRIRWALIVCMGLMAVHRDILLELNMKALMVELSYTCMNDAKLQTLCELKGEGESMLRILLVVGMLAYSHIHCH